MPLTTCPDCQREVSDRLAACPHCGCPLGKAAASPAPSRTAEPEREVWSGGPSQWSALALYIICGLLCFLVVPLFIALWKYLTLRCTRHVLTTQRLTTRTGVFNRQTEEVELFRVTDTSLDEPFVLRMFGLGNILIVMHDATAPVEALLAIKNAEQVRSLLREQVNAMRERRRVMALEEL